MPRRVHGKTQRRNSIWPTCLPLVSTQPMRTQYVRCPPICRNASTIVSSSERALDTLNGVKGDRPTNKTVEQLQAERKEALKKWNSSAHYSSTGLRYGSLFWNSAPSRVTSGYDQQIKEIRYHNIATKYLQALITSRANGQQFERPWTWESQFSRRGLQESCLCCGQRPWEAHGRYLALAVRTGSTEREMRLAHHTRSRSQQCASYAYACDAYSLEGTEKSGCIGPTCSRKLNQRRFVKRVVALSVTNHSKLRHSKEDG